MNICPHCQPSNSIVSIFSNRLRIYQQRGDAIARLGNRVFGTNTTYMLYTTTPSLLCGIQPGGCKPKAETILLPTLL